MKQICSLRQYLKKLVMIFLVFAITLSGYVITFPSDASAGDAYGYDIIVSAPDGYCNLRTGPGRAYGVLSSVYNKEILHVYGESYNYDDGLNWGRTVYNGMEGWISLSQTSKTDPDISAGDYYLADYYVVVSAPDGYCNLRTGPGLGTGIITPIYNGETLYISNARYNPEDGLTWGQTYYRGSIGWISLSQTTWMYGNTEMKLGGVAAGEYETEQVQQELETTLPQQEQDFSQPVVIIQAEQETEADNNTWICSNGHEGNTDAFCPKCGEARPEKEAKPDSDNVVLSSHLIISAASCDLICNDTTDIDITFSIPEEWAISDIQVYLDDELYTLISQDNLYLSGEVLIAGHLYKNYVSTVSVYDIAEDIITRKMYAVMNGQYSNKVVLYRMVTVDDRVVEDACAVIDGLKVQLVEYINDYKGSDDKDCMMAIASDYLLACPDVKITEQTENQISFVTSDGFSSFFEYYDEESGMAGNGSIPTTDPAALEQELDLSVNSKEVIINPDVLIMRPLTSTDSGRRGDKAKSAGEILAKSLGTVLHVADDDVCLSWQSIRDWEKYGTVILITHGGKSLRKDGSGTYRVSLKWWYVSAADVSFDSYLSIARFFGDSLPESKKTYSIEGSFNKMMFLADENSTQAAYGLVYFKEQTGLGKSEDNFKYEIQIYTDAIMHLCADAWFPNTIFYFGACDAISDDRFNQFLIDHGASYVIGYQEGVSDIYEEDVCKAIFEEVTKENQEYLAEASGQNYSVQEAFDRSKYFNLILDTAQIVVGPVNNNTRFASGVKDYSIRDFWYKGYGTLEGNVTDIKDNPLEGVTVKAYRYLQNNQSDINLVFSKQTKTDEKGHYKFDKLDWGLYLIQAYNDNDESFVSVCFADPKKDGVDLILEDFTIYGYVIEKKSGDPLSGVQVICENEDDLWVVFTDADGYYKITGLKSAEYTLTFSKDDYNDETIFYTILPDDEYELEIPTVEMEKPSAYLLAYLQLLKNNYSQIATYTWQYLHWENGTRINDKTPTPVVICDVYGDEIPEMIYITGQERSGYSESTINIVTYENDAIKKLYVNDRWDCTGGIQDVRDYYLFQLNSDKTLYMWRHHSLAAETYSRLERNEQGEPEMVGLFSTVCYDTDPYPTYFEGEYDYYNNNMISEGQYLEQEASLQSNMSQVLIYNANCDEFGRDFALQNGCPAMTLDEAITWLEEQIAESAN